MENSDFKNIESIDFNSLPAMDSSKNTKHNIEINLDVENQQVSKLPKPENTFRHNLILANLCIGYFTIFHALSIMAPFFPGEALIKGVSTTMSGVVFTIYSGIFVVASPFLGSYVTKRIGPKNLLLSGTILVGLSNIVFGLLVNVDGTTLFLTSCIVVRIIEGLGACAFSIAGFTFAAETIPRDIGATMGIIQVFIGMGLATGPAVGGWLFDWGGYQVPFHFVGILFLLTLPVSFTILPSIFPKKIEEEKSAWRILTLLPVLLVALVTIVVGITWSFRFPTLSIHLQDFNLDAKQIGFFFLLFSGSYGLTGILAGFILERVKRLWILMIIGLLLLALATFLLGPSEFTGLKNSIWLNIVALALSGISSSIALLPTFKAMLDYAVEGGFPDGVATYGLIGGVWNCVYNLGETIGPVAGGWLTDEFGFPLCTSVIAWICIITAAAIGIYFQFIHRFLKTKIITISVFT